MAGEYKLSSVHVHSKLCDGKNTLDELAVTAWKAGLKTLGFTGHSHTPCDIEYCMTKSRTALYRAQVAKLKERYAGKMDILCGLEWDLNSDDDPAAYDYTIGSAHYVRGPKTGRYYEIDFRPADLAACIQDDFDGDGLAVVEAYFRNVEQVVAHKPTILGHFDLIKKINRGNKFFDEGAPRYEAAANAALDAAAAARCVLEVNTSGLRQKIGRTLPDLPLLRRYRELGGRLVTLGSDAHRPDHGAEVRFEVLCPHDGFGIVIVTAREQKVRELFRGGGLFDERGKRALLRFDERICLRRGSALAEAHFLQDLERVLNRRRVDHSAQPLRTQEPLGECRSPGIGKNTVRHVISLRASCVRCPAPVQTSAPR